MHYKNKQNNKPFVLVPPKESPNPLIVWEFVFMYGLKQKSDQQKYLRTWIHFFNSKIPLTISITF